MPSWTAASKTWLAEPQVENALRLIASLGLEERVNPRLVVEHVLAEATASPGFLAWVRRLLQEPVDEEDGTGLLVRRYVELCEAGAQPAAAQAIRREASLILFDTGLLRDWLDRLSRLRRQLEEQRVLREVARLEGRSNALLFLPKWPDLDAAAQLVMQHYDTMVGLSAAARSIGLLEASAPRAAMLLYRRGAFCQFDGATEWSDSKPRLATCAALWARHPDTSHNSHAVFMNRLAQERSSQR